MKPFSTIGSDQIRKAPTNNSTSKNAYAFSKEKRFGQPNPQHRIGYYVKDEQMSQLSRRRASFGYGKKSDFTKDQTVSPRATLYSHKSVFDQDTSTKRGKSFGLSRQKSPDRSYLIPQIHKHPGPGNYQNQKQTKMVESFTMRPKTLDFIGEKLTYKKNPGPGSYNEVDLDPKTGRFTVSKFSDAKFSKINPNTPRFFDAKQSPGPSSYMEGDSMQGSAKYVLSQHRGNGTRAFEKTARLTFTDDSKKKAKVIPGPGDYELPTQFGVYGDNKYYKTMKDFSTIN